MLRSFQSIFLTVGCVFLATTANAQTYDLANDFSYLSNPNGVWSYGFEKTAGGTFTPYTTTSQQFTNFYRGWSVNDPFGGQCWKSFNTVQMFGVRPGQVSLHPSSNQNPSVVRWTAPNAGNVDLAGFFGNDGSFSDSYGGGGTVLNRDVYFDNNPLFDKREGQKRTNFQFNNFPVKRGDTLDFMIYGGFNSGNTPISAAITYRSTVPAPSALLTVLVGIAPGAMLLRRLRK